MNNRTEEKIFIKKNKKYFNFNKLSTKFKKETLFKE